MSRGVPDALALAPCPPVALAAAAGKSGSPDFPKNFFSLSRKGCQPVSRN